MKTTLALLSALLLLARISTAQVSINSDQSQPDVSAMLDIKSIIKGFLPPRMSTTQMNAIPSPATGLVIYNTSLQSIYWYDGSAWKQVAAAGIATTHYIGENFGGGIIFFVYDGGMHGLIAATSDLGSGSQWHNGINRLTGSAGDGFLAGSMNSCLITCSQLPDNQNGQFAARLCEDYSVTAGGITYGDWYLPSRYELNLLYQQKTVVGGFSNADYWSSTEISNTDAWSQYFFDGSQSSYGKDGALLTRPIRAF